VSLRFFSALFALAAAGCGEDYVRIVIEGSAQDVSATPVGISISVYGGGEATRYDYTDTLETRGSNVPSSDSVVTFSDGAPSRVVVRAKVTTPVTWGADTKLSLPAEGSTVRLQISPGERDVATNARFDGGDGTTATVFRGGLAFAWATLEGLKVAELRQPDANVSAVTRERLLTSDPGVSHVRIAARPGTSTFASDSYAVAWRDGGLETHLVIVDSGRTSSTLSLGTSDDVQLALARPGLAFDAVAVLRKGSVLEAQTFTIDSSGEPVVLATPTPVLQSNPVDQIIGVVTTADAFVVGARSAEKTLLAKSGPGGEGYLEATLDGQARAIARSIDGNLVFLANDLGGTLSLESHFAGDLAPAGGFARFGKLPFVPEHPRARVSISECAIAWPEIRDDGSGLVDLRVELLDDNGRPRSSPVYANIDDSGDHYSPTAVCVSPTRAYVAFFAEMPDNPVTGTLRVRRVPSDLSLSASNTE